MSVEISLNLETFSSRVGEEFCVEDGSVSFTLVEAAELPAHRGTPREDPFSLVFRAPPACDCPQATYHLRHDQLGEFAIFLVPIGVDEDGMLYQAVFN